LSSRRSAFATWSVVFVFALFQAETTSWSAWKKRKEKEGGAMDWGEERRDAREKSQRENFRDFESRHPKQDRTRDELLCMPGLARFGLG